jgi:hypothetical protein
LFGAMSDSRPVIGLVTVDGVVGFKADETVE